MSDQVINHITQIDPTQSDIIRALLYFDIFDYPLKREEIKKFMASSPNGEFDRQFNDLINSGYINQVGRDFYGIAPEQSNASRRIKGNLLAEKKMKSARRMSRLISYFPFVRCIMLSGSISKGFMEANSDVDFFIITAPKKLWIARTLLILFKRLFLLNSRKLFCVNYFLDSESMEIEEKNIFTAIECATLIPTYNSEYYTKFWNENSWVSNYLPNTTIRDTTGVISNKAFPFKWLIEKLLSNRLGDFLDQYFMNITLKHWNSRYSKELDEGDFKVAFKTKRNVSKSHPQFFQKKVLNTLASKQKEYEISKSVNLSN